jgi:prepilin-type N-terminal cleavage/methylation domain-containing protein/prepilin-type processing-associated H-X9-DG protein
MVLTEIKNPPRPVAFKRICDDGFTLIELLLVLATLAILTTVLLPALAGTRPNVPAYQCLNNQRQLILGWQMYATDNNSLLPPNNYPYMTAYYTYAIKSQLNNWAVGTMAQPLDASQRFGTIELTSANSLLSPYVTNASTYHCPADNYIDPNTHATHVRSYSMNSAVGTIWYGSYSDGLPLGAPVQGGWLPGAVYNPNQTTWLTYGKMSSFTRPGPANTWVLIDENPYSINDGSFAAPAAATPGATYLIDFPASNHGKAGVLAFADGHVIVHQWQDPRTYTPYDLIQPGGGSQNNSLQTPDNPDCFYLAPLTSARR